MPKMNDVSLASRRINRKLFAQEYVANGGNATQAMLKVKPMKYLSARTRGNDILHEADVQEEIKRIAAKLDVGYEFIFSTRKTIIKAGLDRLKSGGMKVSASDVHNHLLGLENVLKRVEKDGSQSNSKINVNIKMNYSDALKKRNTYSKFFDDIVEGEVLKDEQEIQQDAEQTRKE